MQVYLDNSATTKMAPEVIQSMTQVMEKYYGNPSSLHRRGMEAEQLLSRSRESMATWLGISPEEAIFTSGGTESNNLAIKGVAFAFQNRGKHIVTSRVEHAATYEVLQALEKDFGYEVTYVPVDQWGRIDPADIEQALRDDTILVTLIHVNNELGTVQPVEEIGQMLSQYPKVLFHVDHVQGIGKKPLNIKERHIDLLSISGHKIHGPKGIGLLYVREGVHLYPLIQGGGQQKEVRPGTENVPGSVGLARAIRLVKEGEAEHIRHVQKLKQQTVAVLEELEGVVVNQGCEEDFAPHILNVSFPGIKPEVLLHALEDKGIYVSTKSACSSKADEPSRILKATHMDEQRAKSALRISFSMYNTEEEVEYFGAVLRDILPYYQKVMKV